MRESKMWFNKIINYSRNHTPVGMIQNTSGEWEREARSRRFNVIEPFFMMTFLLMVLWYYQYPFGILREDEFVNLTTTIILTAAALYCLFASPTLHRDTLCSWGLGNPRTLWKMIRQPHGGGWVIGIIVGGLIIFLTIMFYNQWIAAARFLFGMKRTAAETFTETISGKLAVAILGLGLSTFFCVVIIRYDNFLSSLRTALKIILFLGSLLYGWAFLVMDTKAFSDFEGKKFALDVFGYIFWGALQQLLFCSYFGTRLRKGFAPARHPDLVWRKRLAISVLNGAFFGIIHINSWALVGVCWLLGCFLAWVFMEDRNRNLVALGFIHGFLGSSVGWLFDRDKAGGFHIEMGVGPTHVEGFDPLTMVVVTGIIVGFCLFMLTAAKKFQED